MQHGDDQDQRAIRAVVAEWLAATKRGDSQSVLDLMTDDALFLLPGRPPMDKAEFKTSSESQTGGQMAVEGTSDIKEIYVEGSVGYLWSHLTVTVTPPGGAAPIRRAGHTLTIFRKIGDRWLLARDANLLVQV
jgi:conserved hypothetical protein